MSGTGWINENLRKLIKTEPTFGCYDVIYDVYIALECYLNYTVTKHSDYDVIYDVENEKAGES